MPNSNHDAHDELLAFLLERRSQQARSPIVIGLCGSQGSGKSTLARSIKKVLQESHGRSAAILSLDDLYLSRAMRAHLAATIHPLLRTRGVPGTHDVLLGIDLINRLKRGDTDIPLPRFNKALDEHGPPERIDGAAEIIIFEGWFVGAVSQHQEMLKSPVNALERDYDANGVWRAYVNSQLAGPYQTLFAALNCLVLLKAPSFDVVFDWRRQQECSLAKGHPISASNRPLNIMADDELRHFIAHYERLTRHILSEMPARADLVLNLDAERRVVGAYSNVSA